MNTHMLDVGMVLDFYHEEHTYPHTDKIEPVDLSSRNVMGGLNKPAGGLWTSPQHSKYSWAHYALDDGLLGTDDVHYRLKFQGRVYCIDSEEALDALPEFIDGHVAWDKLASLGIDAVWVTPQALPLRGLWGWDCETVLVINRECVSDWEYVDYVYAEQQDGRLPKRLRRD